MALAGLFALVLVMASAASTYEAFRAIDAEHRAQEHLAQVVAEQDAKDKALQRAKAEGDAARRAEKHALDEALLRRGQIYATHILLARQAIKQSFPSAATSWLERHRDETPDLRTFEWHYLWRQCQQQRIMIDAECGTVTSLRYAPDGRSLYSKGADYNLWKWNVLSGRSLWQARGSVYRGADDLLLGDGGNTLLSREKFGATLLDASTGTPIANYKRDAVEENNFLPTPDGRTVLVPGKERWQLVDVGDGSIKRELKAHEGLGWSFSADGKWMASRQTRNKVLLVDRTTDETKLIQFNFPDADHWTHMISLSPDGQRAVIGAWIYDVNWSRSKRTENSTSWEGHSESGGFMPYKDCLLCDLRTGATLGRLAGHSRGLTAVAFSRDGKHIATAANDGLVRLWDGQTGASLGVAGWHDIAATALEFSPDGSELASGGQDGKIKIWRLNGDANQRVALGAKAGVFDLAVSRDAKLVAAVGRKDEGDNPGVVWLLDADSGQVQQTIDQPELVTSVAFHPQQPLAAWRTGKAVVVWNLELGEVQETLNILGSSPGAVRFTPDGKVLLASDGAELVIWDFVAGKKLATIEGRGWDKWPDVNKEGTQLAIADWGDNKAELYSLPGAVRADSLGEGWFASSSSGGQQGENVAKGAYSPDGQLFALPGRTGESQEAIGQVQLIDMSDKKVVHTLADRSDHFLCVAFSPDGRTVATGMRSGSILFWDPATGEQRMHLDAHQGQVTSLTFSSDGSLLVSGAWDGSVAFHRTSAQ